MMDNIPRTAVEWISAGVLNPEAHCVVCQTQCLLGVPLDHPPIVVHPECPDVIPIEWLPKEWL